MSSERRTECDGLGDGAKRLDVIAEVGAADQTSPVDLDRGKVTGREQLVNLLTGSR